VSGAAGGPQALLVERGRAHPLEGAPAEDADMGADMEDEEEDEEEVGGRPGAPPAPQRAACGPALCAVLRSSGCGHAAGRCTLVRPGSGAPARALRLAPAQAHGAGQARGAAAAPGSVRHYSVLSCRDKQTCSRMGLRTRMRMTSPRNDRG